MHAVADARLWECFLQPKVHHRKSVILRLCSCSKFQQYWQDTPTAKEISKHDQNATAERTSSAGKLSFRLPVAVQMMKSRRGGIIMVKVSPLVVGRKNLPLIWCFAVGACGSRRRLARHDSSWRLPSALGIILRLFAWGVQCATWHWPML